MTGWPLTLEAYDAQTHNLVAVVHLANAGDRALMTELLTDAGLIVAEQES